MKFGYILHKDTMLIKTIFLSSTPTAKLASVIRNYSFTTVSIKLSSLSNAYFGRPIAQPQCRPSLNDNQQTRFYHTTFKSRNLSSHLVYSPKHSIKHSVHLSCNFLTSSYLHARNYSNSSSETEINSGRPNEFNDLFPNEEIRDDTGFLSEGADVVEKSFSELGLASPLTPVGWVQSILESLHVSYSLPWWSSIIIVTVLIRIATFPIMIASRKSIARLHNHMPQIVIMQQRITAARMAKNNMEAAMLTMQLNEYYTKHRVNPFMSTLLPLCTAPAFMSMFLALRSMAILPVESLKTGGLFWFTDLTIPDPYYALPIVTSLTLLVVLEVGGETGISSKNMSMVKNVMRVFPFIFLPVTITFPSAVLTYWMTNNFLTLIQAIILKNPSVRDKLGIPIVISPPDLPKALSKKGFVQSLHEALSNSNVSNEIQDRRSVGALKIKPSKVIKNDGSKLK